MALVGFAAAALHLIAATAWAGTPGADTRRGLLPLGQCTGLGAPPDGAACVDANDCEAADGSFGVCTTQLSEVAIRGVLWLIADKDAGTWDDATPIPLTTDERGDPVPSDLSGSALTLVLEFTRGGVDHVIAETYKDLPDYVRPDLGIECFGFCIPLWREDAVESRIATLPADPAVGSDGVRIRWATLPPIANAALVEALGLPADAVPFLEFSSEKDLFDRSDEDDMLASVRRLKVTIRAIVD